MPKRAVFDRGLLARTLAAQLQVINRRQALACGISPSTVNFWCRPNGKWQKLLPGVYLTVTGKPTSEQRLVAAMLYAGSRAAITGPAALRLHRLRCPGPDAIDVLVPWAVKRQSVGFVRIHRTTRMPNVYRSGVVRFAGPARSVADAAHLFTSLDDVKSVVAEAIQKRACSIVEIGLELEKGASRDSRRLREALASARTGVRSVAKRSRLLKHGIFPHNIAPARVTSDWDAVYEELSSSLEIGRKRPRLPIVAFDPAA